MKPAFILFSAVIAACPFVSRAHSDHSVATREYPVASHGTLIVDINRANVVIEPSSTQMLRITAREHCARPDALTPAILDVSVAHSLTHVHITADESNSESTARRAELIVQVPAGFNVRVRDDEGNVRVGKIEGLVDATTHFGTVRLDRSTRVARTVATASSLVVVESPLP